MQKSHYKLGLLASMSCFFLLAGATFSAGNAHANKIVAHHTLSRTAPHIMVKILRGSTRHIGNRYLAQALISGVGFTSNGCPNSCGTNNNTNGCSYNNTCSTPATFNTIPNSTHTQVTKNIHTTTTTTTTTTNVSNADNTITSDDTCGSSTVNNTDPCGNSNDSNNTGCDSGCGSSSNTVVNASNNSSNGCDNSCGSTSTPAVNNSSNGCDNSCGSNSTPAVNNSSCNACNTVNLQSSANIYGIHTNLSSVPVNAFGEFQTLVGFQVMPTVVRNTSYHVWAINNANDQCSNVVLGSRYW